MSFVRHCLTCLCNVVQLLTLFVTCVLKLFRSSFTFRKVMRRVLICVWSVLSHGWYFFELNVKVILNFVRHYWNCFWNMMRHVWKSIEAVWCFLELFETCLKLIETWRNCLGHVWNLIFFCFFNRHIQLKVWHSAQAQDTSRGKRPTIVFGLTLNTARPRRAC